MFKIDLNPLAIPSVMAGYSATIGDPWDVKVIGGYIYATYPRVNRVSRLDQNLNFIDEYKGLSGDVFYGPRRFVAILNKKITLIDEFGHVFIFNNLDRLVSMSDMDAAGALPLFHIYTRPTYPRTRTSLSSGCTGSCSITSSVICPVRRYFFVARSRIGSSAFPPPQDCDPVVDLILKL